MRTGLTTAIDRRLVDLIRARARRRSIMFKLLPEAWLRPLLSRSARRLRAKLLVAILASSVLLAGGVAWLALQA